MTRTDASSGALGRRTSKNNEQYGYNAHICADMSEDALDYIATLLKREAGRV